MKKKELSYEEALAVLKRGKSVMCQLSKREDDTEVVRDASRLKYLYTLSKEDTQWCKLYPILNEKVKLSEESIEVSFDEAYEMVYSGELIYYKENGEEEEITTTAELVSVRRKVEARGQKLLLYWHE